LRHRTIHGESTFKWRDVDDLGIEITSKRAKCDEFNGKEMLRFPTATLIVVVVCGLSAESFPAFGPDKIRRREA
jgi:hypothetical protein